MAEQPWFETTLPPAEWLRLYRATGEAPQAPLGSERTWSFSRVNGHHAIEWIEQHADGTAGDQLLVAEDYFRHAECRAEADRFSPSRDQQDEMEIRYGAAHWLLGLVARGPELWNVLDYYLATFPGQFYRWAGWRPFHSQHQAIATGLINDILGGPLQSTRFDATWRTVTAVTIASAMYETRNFSPAPILADALEDAGCDNDDVLTHCRTEGLHCRGCWVVDLLLEKS